MRYKLQNASLSLLALLITSANIWASPSTQKAETLVIEGQMGQAAVIRVDGRAYVDVETLAHIANWSVSFKANRIVLNLQPNAGDTPAATDTPNAAPPTQDDSSLSRDFMRSGMEAIAQMREWASPLANAIQNGYPVTESWVAGYREQAAHALSLASVAAATDSDRRALQLLTNEFEAVRQWSNKLVEARKSMNTAQYTMSASALRDDPLSQKIVSCGRFLAPMLASGSFQDDSSCH
jgi:hypothetical protein